MIVSTRNWGTLAGISISATLRTVLSLLRPHNFPSLSTFVLEFKHLLSYVDTSFCPIPLIADILVAAIAGTQAGTSITQMEMDRGSRPSLTEMLKALTCMGHAISPRATRALPVIMAAAGWSLNPHQLHSRPYHVGKLKYRLPVVLSAAYSTGRKPAPCRRNQPLVMHVIS